jgi:ubiquinone/menaquinone biosynthesis C-methylase UbiE
MPFDHFQLIAGLYNRASDFIPSPAFLKKLDLKPDCLLLDVGGGTGRIAIALRQMVREVIVVDISLGMLGYAASKGLITTCSPGEHLPFPSETFDRIIMVDALHHIIAQQRAVLELWRVLIPGGKIVIIEPNIRKFAVKLIAFGEKMLLMRSHFLDRGEIITIMTGNFDKLEAISDELNIWICAEKVGKM